MQVSKVQELFVGKEFKNFKERIEKETDKQKEEGR